MAQRILVVIPTLNEARTIARVLSELSRDLPSTAVTTFVVADGGSTDGTTEVVGAIQRQRPELRLMQNPERIQAAAVNAAARRYGQDADVLVRCDAHAGYPSGFVRGVIETLERTGADSVVVPMDSSGETCLQKAVAWVSDTPLGSGGSAHRGGHRSGFVDHGHHAAFRMGRFRDVGGYDQTFTHNEDAELDCRLRAIGAKIYLDADIRVVYRPRATFSGLWRQYFAYGRGRSRTVRRHPGSIRARQLAVPLHLALCVLAVVVAAWLPLLLWWPALYLALLGVASVGLAVRHRAACGLLAGPAACVMHLAWATGFYWGLLCRREQRWRGAITGLPQANHLGGSA
ncbi:MAG: glycosyltransferase family 2 protein [Burkholderiales bacterium]|nr:glycosyltransferase family 2 protein [Burkholderiales bacterium]